MNRFTVRIVQIALLAVILALAAACDEIDEDVVEVGLLQIHPVHPAQTVPTLGEDSVQSAKWMIPAATIQFPEAVSDLAPSDDCLFMQSYIALSTGSGDCMLGAAVEVSPSPLTGVLDLTAELEVTRVGQVDVTPGGDLDGDGVLNQDDNCPIVPNPGQESVVDAFGDDIGEACAFDSSGGEGDPVWFLDSELDEVPDVADNCPFHPNPGQENTQDPSLPAGFPTDGIGDACSESAVVSVAGQTTFTLDVDLDPYVQERRRMLLVLDFGPDLSGLTCDWNAGTCSLEPGSIRACVLNDRLTAAAGCP